MQSRKVLIAMLVAIILCTLFYIEVLPRFGSWIAENGKDALAVILLIGFAAEILLRMSFTPFALFGKFNALVCCRSNDCRRVVFKIRTFNSD